MAEKQTEDGERMTQRPDRIFKRQADRGLADGSGRMILLYAYRLGWARLARYVHSVLVSELVVQLATDTPRAIPREGRTVCWSWVRTRSGPEVSDRCALGGQPSS